MRILFASLLATSALGPVIRGLMIRHGILDVPNHRSSHLTPIPRGGGLACLGGVAVGACTALTLHRTVPWVAIVAALALSLLGFADDRASLPPGPRLAVQCIAGATMGAAAAGPLGAVFGALVTIWAVNVVNFMDGINGITGLTMALWGASTLAVGLFDHLTSLVVLGGLTAGSALGFLPWNLPTARLFLGDSGSYLFGGLAAAGLVIAARHGAHPVLVAAPLTMYAADTTGALVRRARRGEPLTEAHKEHVYQQLTSGLGYPHWGVSVGLFIASAGVTASWLLPWPVALTVTIVVASLYLALPSLLRRGAPTYPSLPGRQSI